MLMMKKDMGGAANVLALAADGDGREAEGPVAGADPRGRERGGRQRVSSARRLQVAQGLTVEIGNTDAEGRLILADALALADEEKPDLLVDLGYSDWCGARGSRAGSSAILYSETRRSPLTLRALAKEISDPVWRMPLWPAYRFLLDSKIADINNVPSGGFAGSIVARCSCSAL